MRGPPPTFAAFWCAPSPLSALPEHPSPTPRTDYAHDQQALSDLWGLGVDSHNLRLLDDGVARQLGDAGLNVMLVDKHGLSRGQRARVDQLAPRFGFRKITLPRKLTRSSRAGKAFCARAKRRHPGGTCTLRTASLHTAGQLASSRNVDLVVVRLKGLPALMSLRIHGKHARVMVMVEIGQHGSVDTTAWSAAIRQAAGEQGVDLAVAPRGTQGTHGPCELRERALEHRGDGAQLSDVPVASIRYRVLAEGALAASQRLQGQRVRGVRERRAQGHRQDNLNDPRRTRVRDGVHHRRGRPQRRPAAPPRPR